MRTRLDDISVRHLRYALAVEAAGSVTGAAENLHVAQPSVSQQLRKLEGRLGTPLFERTRTGLTATPEAREFLRSIGLLLSGLEESVARLPDTWAPWRVGVSPGLGVDVVAAAEAIIRRSLPGVRPELSADSSAELVRALERGALDIGVVRAPVVSPTLEQALLVANELGVVVGCGHPLLLSRTVEWGALDGLRLLWFDEKSAPLYASEIVEHLARHRWTPEREPGPARHALFQHRLMSDHSLVALRPRGARGAESPLRWLPIRDDPPVERVILVAASGTRGGDLVADMRSV